VERPSGRIAVAVKPSCARTSRPLHGLPERRSFRV
jgi:ribosomal protein L34E